MSEVSGESAGAVMAKWLARDQRLEWLAVRLDEVRPGDRYANGATVTKSRKAKPGEVGNCSVNGEPVPVEDCWHIRCGKSMSVTTHRGRPVIVGRRASVTGRSNSDASGVGE